MLIQLFILSLLGILDKSQQQVEKIESAINSNNKKNLINVVSDVIKMENAPIKNLDAFTCWDRYNTNKFLKEMSSKHQTKLNNWQKNRKDQTTNVFSHRSYTFFLDLSCPHSNQILETASQLKLFKSPFIWILFGNNSSNLINFYFGVDSKIYLIEKNNNNTNSYTIKIIFKLSQNLNVFKEQILAKWNNTNKLIPLNSNQKIIISNRFNLEKTALKISYVITHPDSINHLLDYRDKHIDAISKMNYILVNHLIDFLNATKIEIIRTTWGYKNTTTGIYSGMAGDLQTGFADLGGTPLFFTIDRVEIIDYIAATTPTFMKFIFRSPPLSYVTNVYTLPFDATVWHYSFIMIAVIAICIYIIVWWEWIDPQFREKIQYGNYGVDALRANIFDVLLMELGAVTQQGTDKEPKSYAGRIATIFTFLILMFMYTSYSANIVALLQSTTDSIRTLEDLLNSRITLGAEDIVYAHHYFETAQEPIRKAIYQQKIAPKGQKANFMTIEDGIRRVQQGFFAFHVELANGYKVVGDLFQENEKCGLKEIEYVNLIEPWLSAQKNSPYKEVMKVGLKKIVERGIRKREYNRIYTKKPACQSTGSNFGSVGLIDCYSAFLIFAIGIITSIIILIIEIVTMRYTIKKRLNVETF